MDIKLPQRILDFVSNLPYEVDEVGMSDSEVRIYDKYILKIQRKSEETDNEYEISSFLKDKISVLHGKLGNKQLKKEHKSSKV